MAKNDYSTENLSFWDKWKPSAIDFSAIRPREMWSHWGPPEVFGGRGEEHPNSAANVRDLFGQAWHGQDWRRQEQGMGEGNAGRAGEDRYAVPFFRAAYLGALGSMGNSFGSPFSSGPGYGTTARMGGGLLNNMGSMGGLAGALGGGGMGSPQGGGSPEGMIEPYQAQDPFQSIGNPNDSANLAMLLSMLQRKPEEQDQPEHPLLGGYGVV